MKEVKEYFKKSIGLDFTASPMLQKVLSQLPLYLIESFQWHRATIAQTECVLAEVYEGINISIATLSKQMEKAARLLKKPVIVVFHTIEAYNRKRLIEKRIAFIVPGKQLYIPQMMIDLREVFTRKQQKQHQLSPLAQAVVLFHLLYRKKTNGVENKSFRELAFLFKTNAMAITRAIQNLQELDLAITKGNKEKHIQFIHNPKELWLKCIEQNFFFNPVMKVIFADEKPGNTVLLKTNGCALPEYTNLNPTKQQFFAIDKTNFYDLKKRNIFINMNEFEGKYAFEVWKYNPVILFDKTPNELKVVDPLSLYLSFKSSEDERIEMALEQIIEKYIW